MVSWCLAIGYPESGFVIKQCAVLIQQKIHPFHSYQAEGPFYSHMILMWNQSYKGFEGDDDVDERFDTRMPTRPEHHQLQTSVTLVSESHGLSIRNKTLSKAQGSRESTVVAKVVSTYHQPIANALINTFIRNNNKICVGIFKSQSCIKHVSTTGVSE